MKVSLPAAAEALKKWDGGHVPKAGRGIVRGLAPSHL